MMRRALLAFALFWACAAAAEERILAYHSEIEIRPDSSLAVTETIRVRAEGHRIRRGIYREFPTVYTSRSGERVTVSFEVEAVRRDGASEPYHTQRRANGVAVYAGRADRTLPPGEYTYEIRYRTDRQVGFFPDHDELYWNVTGVGWVFPIDVVTARVHLPPGTPYPAVQIEGYTGPQGSTQRAYRAELGDGVVEFRTTRKLTAFEGLTVVVSWPKGLVSSPGWFARARHFARDELPLVLAALGVCGLLGYYIGVWRRHGRDPVPGVIIPCYRPPEGESAASMRYLCSMGYDNRCFVAGILGLAVKGYLTIEQPEGGWLRKGHYVLHRRHDSQTPLTADEHALLRTLLGSRESLVLSDENYALLRSAQHAHRAQLKSRHRNTSFRLNQAWRYLGMALTLLVVFGGVIGVARAAGFGPDWFLFTRGGWATLGLGALALAVNTWFARILPAPTPDGRRRMDAIEGFRLYLSVAEGDELQLAGAPRKTPGLYEMYLPFALALGVSQRWSEQFAEVFKLQPQYAPGWYSGDGFDGSDLGGFASSLSDSFDSAIASASAPPGDSSGSSSRGGGGGSSGGGGGGGGGGGW
jgi:uncharacterized membrane protein YgcG